MGTLKSSWKKKKNLKSAHNYKVTTENHHKTPNLGDNFIHRMN